MAFDEHPRADCSPYGFSGSQLQRYLSDRNDIVTTGLPLSSVSFTAEIIFGDISVLNPTLANFSDARLYSVYDLSLLLCHITAFIINHAKLFHHDNPGLESGEANVPECAFEGADRT